MLCVNCRLIFDQEVIEKIDHEPGNGDTTFYEATYSYTITYQDFLLATNKCHCCLEMLRSLQQNAEDEDNHVPSEEDDHVPSEEKELHFELTLDWYERSGTKWYDRTGPKKYYAVLYIRAHVVNACPGGRTFDPGGRKFRIVLREDRELLQLNSGIHNALPNNTGSAYTAEFVKNCLQRCKQHKHTLLHTPWSHGGDPQWYPTRLVEVLDDGEAKLVETSETPPAGPYATLSHCWGTSGTFTTTTKNIADLKKHIPFLDLPKTFRDTLHFAKSIGVSLIWIDSLCIIQDSAEDWESESRTMLKVYQYAECNLAAAAFKDSHGGLFSERNYTSLPSGCFKVGNNVPWARKEMYSVVRDDYFKDEFNREVGTSRLLSRGWVYQERSASRRVVVFGRDHVFWDCPELLESDVLPGYDASVGYYGKGVMAVPKCITPVISRGTLSSLDDAFSAWKEVVRVYSACDFTYITDKPIAILGVAEMMGVAQKANFMDDDSGWEDGPRFTPYWGGLWHRDIFRQLAWKVGRTGLRKNSYAPSWSWLSIEGPVEWQDFHLEGYYAKRTLTSALATIAWSDQQSKESRLSFTEVSSDLKIWCGLHTFRVTDPPGRGSWDGDYYREAPSEQLLYMTSSKGIGLELKPNDLDCEDVDVKTLYFLPLVYNYTKYGDYCGFENYFNVVGILVQPTDDQIGTYRRCGSASYHLPKELYPYAPVTEIPQGRYRDNKAWVRRQFRLSTPLPSAVGFSYQKYDPELGYLIRII